MDEIKERWKYYNVRLRYIYKKETLLSKDLGYVTCCLLLVSQQVLAAGVYLINAHKNSSVTG
jgi:hypothetical protein